MSKLLLSIYVTLLVVLISCNSTEKKPDAPDPLKDSAYNFAFADTLFGSSTNAVQGLDVFYVPKEDAQAMVNSFKMNYRDLPQGTVTAFDTMYWIDACTLKLLATYFSSNTQYDGMRIYFTANLTDNAGETGAFKRKTKIKIFATSKRVPDPTSDKISKHIDNDNGISLPTTCPQTNYFGRKSTAQGEINMFESYYHNNNRMGDGVKRILSKSLWIDTTVIKFLGKLVENNPKKVDGINILTAAYRDISTEQRPPFSLAKQSTILMVPSIKGSANHESDWNIITGFFNYVETKTKEKGKPFIGAFNKAELCPQVCN